MKLQDLVVMLDGSERAGTVADLAIDIARRHDAHVTGLCPLELLFPSALGFLLSGASDASGLQEAVTRMQARAQEKAQAMGLHFLEQLRRNDVRGGWEAVGGPATTVVTRRARAADLLVIAQRDPDRPLPPSARHLVEDVLMNCGRPLLVVPFAGRFETIGRTVLIGWNDTREAARAAHDALSLIEATANVTLLTVEHAASAATPREAPGADVAEHLARHGLNISASRTTTDATISDADALLAYASDIGADLLVVGGYGHSRARELMLGGVSRGLLDHMTLPVLMSH